MLDKVKRLILPLVGAFESCYLGFVQGHSYFNRFQVKQIKNVLRSIEMDSIVDEYASKLANLLGYNDILIYASGRMAFYSLMKELKITRNDEVILLGSTCSVMVNAVHRIGAKPIFTDIDPDTLGSSPKAILKAINQKTKMIVAQHSFGIPCKIDEIIEIGQSKNVFVLEDCAITFESKYKGKKVGHWGDGAIFSTDHSKPINTLIGGALYVKNNRLYNQLKTSYQRISNLAKDHQFRLFNQFMFERLFYVPTLYFISSYLLIIKNKIMNNNQQYTFLEADYGIKININSYSYPARLPPFLAKIGIYEIKRWKNEKKAREQLLKKYIDISKEVGLIGLIPKAYLNPDFEIVPLRFAFVYPNSNRIERKMKRYIDTSWFWFKKPIIVCNDLQDLGYINGSCPISEQFGKDIINWPCNLDHKFDKILVANFRKVFEMKDNNR
jgi:perosamine synthetase